MTARGFVQGVQLARDRLAAFGRSVSTTSNKVTRFGARLAVVGATKFAALSNAIKRGTTQLARFAKGLVEMGKRLARVIMQLGKYVALLIAAGVAIATIYIRRTLQAMDATAKFADRMGICIKELQRFRYVSRLAGMDLGGFDRVLEQFVRRTAEAQYNLTTYKRAFDELKLDAGTLSLMGTAEALMLVSDRYQTLITDTMRQSVAYAMFGRKGMPFITFLMMGSEKIKELGAAVDKAGAAMNRFDAAKIEAANDAITRAKLVAQGFWQQLSAHLAPYIEATANYMFDLGTASIDTSKLVTKAFVTIGTAVSWVADYLKNVYSTMLKIKAWGMEFAERNVVPMGDMIDGVWHPAPQPVSELEKLLAKIKKLDEMPLGGKVQLMFDDIAKAAMRIGEDIDALAEKIRKRGGPIGVVMEQMRTRAVALVLSLRTPWQVLTDSLNDYWAMFKEKMLTLEQWLQLNEREWGKYDEAINKVKDSLRALADPARLRFAPAVAAGTAAAVRMQWRAGRGVIGAATVAVQQQQLKIQQGIGETAEEMKEMLRRGLRLEGVTVLDVVA